MCRWLACTGSPVFIDELIFKPEHSLIEQSLSATSGATPTNGDGFGIGWRGTKETPGLYRSVQPAWNDRNLRDLAEHIESGHFIAHVRAATGTAVQHSNCHPFRFGKLSEAWCEIRPSTAITIDGAHLFTHPFIPRSA